MKFFEILIFLHILPLFYLSVFYLFMCQINMMAGRLIFTVLGFVSKEKKELKQVTCHLANITSWLRHMKGGIHELFYTLSAKQQATS